MKKSGKIHSLTIIVVVLLIGALWANAPTNASEPTILQLQSTSKAPKEGTPAPTLSKFGLFVEVKAEDGLAIKGSFFPISTGEKGPAVLLLHQNEGARSEWLSFVPELTAAGYNVLAIDQRGFGLTGGKRAYSSLEKDATTVMAWLREQPSVDPDRVAVMGSSVGANVALRVCAADDRCHVVAALSPGASFFGINAGSAVKDMSKKAVLLVAGQMDSTSANAIKALLPAVPPDNSVMGRLCGGVANHGKDLLGYKDVNAMLVSWLTTYNQKP